MMMMTMILMLKKEDDDDDDDDGSTEQVRPSGDCEGGADLLLAAACGCGVVLCLAVFEVVRVGFWFLLGLVRLPHFWRQIVRGAVFERFLFGVEAQTDLLCHIAGRLPTHQRIRPHLGVTAVEFDDPAERCVALLRSATGGTVNPNATTQLRVGTTVEQRHFLVVIAQYFNISGRCRSRGHHASFAVAVVASEGKERTPKA